MQRSPTCPNCCHNFGTQDPSRPHGPRLPLLLQCGHTLCEGCITKLGKQRKSIHCPKCDSVTVVGEHGIFPDIYVLGLLSLNRKLSMDGAELAMIGRIGFTASKNGVRKKKKFKKREQSAAAEGVSPDDMCDECGKKAATAHCIKCECNMCGVCFDKVHHASKILMKHQAFPLNKVTGTVPLICPEHDDKKIDLYCDDCEKAICTHCVLFGEHKPHNYMSLEEKNKEVAVNIEPAVQVAMDTIEKLKSADKVLSNAIPEVKHHISTLTQEIRTHFRTLHGILQIREQILIEELEKSSNEKIEPLVEMKDTVMMNIKKLNMIVKDVHKAKKSNRKLIMNATEMITQLSSARELPCYVVATEENSDERDFDVKFDQLVSTLMTHGRIECRTTPRYELKSSSELPGDWLPPPLLLQQLEDNEDIRSLADSEKAETESIRSDSTTLSSKSRSTTKTSPISKIAKKLVRNSQCSPPRCELVKVTHIKTPCHFMIQRCSDADRYENIRRVINKYCNESRCEAVDDVEVGDIYCCKYAFDKVWYRCRIKSLITIDSDDDDDDDIIEYEQAEIIYIDYGNTEIVPISRLKKLKSKFMLVPELAVRCSLVDIVPTDQTEKWPVGAIHAFASMVGKKPVLMTVLDHSGGVLYIDLQKPPSDDIDNDTPVSVRDALVFLELAQFETPASRPLPGVPMVTPPRKFVLPCLPKKGDYVDIVVSHITNPSDLCIQKLGGELPYLSSLMREMRDTFKTERGDVWQIYCPQLNMICAAKYGLDDNWYRAQVIALPGSCNVEVLYVDYGNTDIVEYTKLLKIPDDFLKLPVQALRCSLADIDVADGEDRWTEAACRRLHDLIQHKSLVAVVIDIIDDIPSVVLYDTTGKADVCINALLVSEGIAKSTGPNSASDKAVIQPVEEKEKAPSMPVGPIATAEKHPAKYKPKCKPANNVAYTEVLVSHIESPACIFAQLATAEEDGLSMLMKSITSYYNALEEIEEKEWEEGDMCAALFVHGEVWCRSRIISLLPGNLCVVLYIDYGNSEVITLDSLRVLKPEFMIPPPYAICCHLSGIQPAGGKNWTRTACEFLVTLICGVQCFLIQKAEYGDEGVATTVPIDLLYESPTTIVTSDTDKAPEPVLESAVQTMILQGLALPCRPQTKSISPVKEQEITLKISPMIEPDEGSEELESVVKNNEISPKKQDMKEVKTEEQSEGIFDDADDFDIDKESKVVDMAIPSEETVVITKEPVMPVVIANDITKITVFPPTNILNNVNGPAGLDCLPSPPGINNVAGAPFGGAVINVSVAPSSVSPRNSPDSFVTERSNVLSYKPPDIPLTETVSLSVTFISKDGMIYGHEVREGNDKLMNVMAKLQSYFKDSEPPSGDIEWRIGQPCSALFSEDEHWYRAKILDITDQDIEVAYIDFGNTETVSVENLRDEVIDTDVPQQCLECLLYGVTPKCGGGKWCDEMIYYMLESLLGNIVTVIIKQPPEVGKPLLVDIMLDESTSLSKVLVHLGWARCFSDNIVIKDVNANPMKSTYKEPTLPPPGVFFPVNVTHINNPSQICIQRVGPQGDGDSLANGAVEGLEELEKISAEMNKRADEFERIENPIPGMACCGQYAYDDEWYRAEVLKVKSVSPLTVEVIYVDYGTTETIPVDRLRELPEEFKILPIQGVRCDLVGLKPPRKIPDDVTLVTGSDWPEGSMLALTKLVVDQRLTACIIKDISKPVKILLFNGIPSDKHCSIIFQPLIEQGLAEMDGDVIDKFTKDFCHLGLKTILSEKTLQMATNEA